MTLNRLIKGAADHLPADARAFEVLPGEKMTLHLRFPFLVAPAEGLADQQANQSDASPRMAGKTEVEKLVRGVCRVARRQRKPPKRWMGAGFEDMDERL